MRIFLLFLLLLTALALQAQGGGIIQRLNRTLGLAAQYYISDSGSAAKPTCGKPATPPLAIRKEKVSITRFDTCNNVEWRWNPKLNLWDSTSRGGSGGGGVTNYYNNGISTFTDTVPYNADGSVKVLKFYTAGKTVDNIQVYDPHGNQPVNGSGFDKTASRTIGDTTYISYPMSPYDSIYFIFSGQLTQVGATTLIATPQGQTSILLAWNSIKHVTGYDLQASYDSVNWTPLALLTDTTYTDTGLVRNQTYFFRVRGVTDSTDFLTGNFAYASAMTAALARIATPSITATGVSADSIRIVISNVANAINYDLKYTTDNITWNNLATLSPGTTTYYHTGLSANTTFNYQVVAVADNVTHSNSLPATDTATTFAAVLQKLSAPQFVAQTISYNEIDLQIKSVPNATGYVFYFFDDNDSTWKIIGDTLAPNTTLLVHAPLSDTTTFNYRGEALGDGIHYLTSDFSYNYATTFAEPTADTFTLIAPVIHASTLSAHVIHITLDTNSHASKIVVERSTNNQTWTTVGAFTPALTAINDSNLLAGTKYSYRAYFEADTTGIIVYLNSTYGYDSATTTAITPLVAPVLTASNINSTSNGLSWTNEANESGYTVQTSPNKAAWTTLTTKAANVTTATHTGLQPGTTYYYRVRANSNNPLFTNSAFSNIDSATTTSGTTVLATPVVIANGIDQTDIVVQWGNVPNASSYTVERSDNGATWTTLPTFTAGTLSFTDTSLFPNTLYNYRVQANGNGTIYLTSAFGYDTAKTMPLQYVTSFGVLSEPGTSGLTQPVITARTSDSLNMCIGRTNWAKVENSAKIDKMLSLGKELHTNLNSRTIGDTAHGYTTDAERAAYVNSLDTVIRRHLAGKSVRFISASNEENNNLYRKIDTVPNSPTNSARLYYFNELKPMDSLAKLIAPGQFITSNGGVTGKAVVWFAWKNLIDSGKTAEAAAFAREVFLPNEIPSIANWSDAKKSPNPVSFRFTQQLIPLLRTSNIDFVNIHPKMPLNGIDTPHINPIVIRDIVQGWHNLTGKRIITDEIAANSLYPSYTTELLQACADNLMDYALLYDGSAYTTIPTAAGKDPALRLQSNGRTLNELGIAAAQKSKELKTQACPIVSTTPTIPTADAGAMKSLVYSGSGVKTTLSGTATNAATTLWTQLSGVSTATIATPASLSSQFSNLQQGVYSFVLTATSSTGNIAKDTTYVSVLTKVTYTAGGLTRTALVHYPPNPALAAPVMFAFHGHSQQALTFAAKLFEVYATNWIIVYPQGLPTPSPSDPNGDFEGWQRTTPYINPNYPGVVDLDVQFYDVMRRDMIDNHHADSTKEFIHGWSNGCQLVYDVLWVVRGNQLAGISGGAGILATASGKNAIPAMHIAGTADDKVNFGKQQGNIPKFQGINTTSTTGTAYATAPGGVIATKYAASPLNTKDFVFLQYTGGHPYPDVTVPPIIVQFLKQETGL